MSWVMMCLFAALLVMAAVFVGLLVLLIVFAVIAQVLQRRRQSSDYGRVQAE